MNTGINLYQWERRTEWLLAAAAVVFLGVYSVQVLGKPHGRETYVLWAVTWSIWGLFILDHVARLCLAPDSLRWFSRHLLDLAVVALPLLRPLRFLRLLLLIGTLQKAVGNVFRGRIIIYTASGIALLIYVASLAVFDKERYQPGATINSFGKALWWSVTTVTTVGYGDVYPVTNVGRVIAVMLMIGGISLAGVVTSWIIQRVAEEETASQVATAAQIDELRVEIREELRERGER